jgi:DNA polymerase-1
VVLIEAEEFGEVFEILCDPNRNLFDELTADLYGTPWNKEQRVRTKAFVHGTNYGREAYSIAQEFDMKQEEAERVQQGWRNKIPNVQKWQERIKYQILHDQEDLTTAFGRRRRFWLVTDDNKKDVVKEALAFVPQSTASDICLSALVELRRSGLDVRLPVHDSIMVECPASAAEDVGAKMKEVMERTAREKYTDKIPFPVDVQIGKSWGDLE